MNETCCELRGFVIEQLRRMAKGRGITLAEPADDVDLLDEGLIDSMGFVELIAAVENYLGHEIDLSGHDLEEFTTLGGFVRVMSAA
ncbi:MAG: phosphopantetheine-binding protein [Phycisphaerae bacterium]